MCSAIKKLHAKFRLSFGKKKKKSISEMSLLFLKYSSGINTLFTTDTIVDFLPRDAARKPEVFIYGYTLQI